GLIPGPSRGIMARGPRARAEDARDATTPDRPAGARPGRGGADVSPHLAARRVRGLGTRLLLLDVPGPHGPVRVRRGPRPEAGPPVAEAAGGAMVRGGGRGVPGSRVREGPGDPLRRRAGPVPVQRVPRPDRVGALSLEPPYPRSPRRPVPPRRSGRRPAGP